MTNGNCSYLCLAKRILKVIDKLISYDQTGYLKGHYIGENIRTVHDVITYLQERNLPGMMLLIDFEKAFDTVKWASIDKTLAFFSSFLYLRFFIMAHKITYSLRTHTHIHCHLK